MSSLIKEKRVYLLKLIGKNLTMNFNNKKALDNVSVQLESGNVIGLIGPNGAGKSTLLKILSTILSPTSGDVLLDGVDLLKNPNSMKNILGYLPQNVPYYPELTSLEYLNYIASLKGLPRKSAATQIQSLLKRFDLIHNDKTRLKNFSGGMLQRIGIIATLLGNPKVIIADEPTTGLDPIQRVILRNILSELAKDRIVLISTHIISDIEAISSKIIMLNKGRSIFQGTVDQLLEQATGKVWEYTIPSNQILSNLEDVSSLVQKTDGIHVRVISNTSPAVNAIKVSPNLEDASLAFLEGRVKNG